MNHEKNNVFLVIENCLDMGLTMCGFLGAYVLASLAFGNMLLTIEDPGILLLLFLGVLVSSMVNQFFNINRPIPHLKIKYRLFSIFAANLVFYGICAIIVLCAAPRGLLYFLLTWLAFSAIICTSILIFKKNIMIHLVRLSRNQRDLIHKLIIVGNNADAANAFVKEVTSEGSGEIMIVGAVGKKMNERVGCEYLGTLDDLEEILDKYEPDYAVFAIESYDKEKIIKFVRLCDDRCIKIYFLPVIHGYFKSVKQVEHLGGLPLINVHSTPLDSKVNAFLKRVVDIAGSLALIVLTSPIMLIAAIGVRLSSPGPILFHQTRVGKMGKEFKMLKFRSMKVNNQSQTAWSTGIDDRKTKFGNFIRKTSIDELPQLFNVLHGTMSLVGPRPEIPHFVEHFKDKIPLYMVKHYVKPGMTGLAQIRGLRGDTSIDDRIHADIEYIENWSLALDIEILLKTPFKAINKNEKYISPEDQGEKQE